MSGSFIALIRKHFEVLLETGLVPETSMWLSCLDIRTGKYPEDDSRALEIGKRAYRSIDAPKGSSMYWDQPMLVCAHALSQVTGDSKYADAADAYERDFLARCIAPNGIFLWGNHYYYSFEYQAAVGFRGDEPPSPECDIVPTGAFHEIRPIPPAWETLWQLDPPAVDKAVRAAVDGHVTDKETGEFQRHADNRRGCAFLEAGGILVEALAWLWTKCHDNSLLEMADRIVEYSWSHRNPETGLIENNPTQNRWDKTTSTTEQGMWAHCLLRAARYCGKRNKWELLACQALSDWLKFGFDKDKGMFYGRLNIADGKPVIGNKTTKFCPGDYADLWEPQFPIHNYPMGFAEGCITAYELTGREQYRQACGLWLKHIRNSTPARGGFGGYAEHYGRCIHFLKRAADVFGDNAYLEQAEIMAEEAIRVLHSGYPVFRTHPGEDRCDAIDGPGWLFLSLIYLETGREPDNYGLGW